MNMPINSTCSWILKNILKQRNVVQGLEEWHNVLQTKKFKMRKFYYVLLDHQQQVQWRSSSMTMWHDLERCLFCRLLAKIGLQQRIDFIGLACWGMILVAFVKKLKLFNILY